MTRRRSFGSDVPFMEWLRGEPHLDSETECIAATDVDAVIHSFQTGVVDSEGRRIGKERQIQALMAVEVKTRGGMPSFSQLDTLFKWSLTIKREHKDRATGCIIRNLGWSFLQLSGTRPENSDLIRWGRFEDRCELLWKTIDAGLLIELLSFRRHPDNFTKQPFRRHHKTGNIWRMETTPLGLTVPVIEVRRS